MKIKFQKLGFLISIILTFFVFGVAKAHATEYYVDPLGTNDASHGTSSGAGAWQTIAYALSHVTNPTTDTIVINIAAGTYIQNNVDLSINRSFTNLTLKGDSASNTFIQSAASTATSTSRVIYIGDNQNITLQNLTIRYGRGESGAGISQTNYATTLNILDCVIDDNDYSGWGAGGINNRGNLNINNSTISNNDCGDSSCGGGLGVSTYNHPELTTKVTNSTFYKNSSPSGGAIALELNAHLVLTNNTIYQGSVNGHGVFNSNNYVYVYLKNNLIEDPDSVYYTAIDLNYGYYLDDRPEIIDGGYNIIETQAGGAKYTFTNGVNGNIVGIQSGTPWASSLSNNGASNGTKTLALLSGSPAINAGNDTAHGPDGNQVTPPVNDQRGKARNGTMDIGSFESQGTDDIDPTITSATLASDNTFVDINFSEGVYNTAGGTGALEPSDFNLTLTAGGVTAASISTLTRTDGSSLTGGETAVRAMLSLTGNPYGTEKINIRPASNDSVFDAVGNSAASDQTTGDLTLAGGTFEYYVDPLGTNDSSHGTSSGTGAWQTIAYALSNVTNPTTVNIIINIGAGTYIQNNVDLSISRSFKNITLKGAGANTTFLQSAASTAASASRVISIGGNQTVTLRDLTVRYGRSESGAGIYQPNSTTVLNLINCVVDDNDHSSAPGAGIYSQGEINITNSTISNNDCATANCGGGLYIDTYNHPEIISEITNSTFYKNAGNGGAITLGLHVHIIFTNNTIYQGTANGNGIYNENNYDYVYLKNNIIEDPDSPSYASIDLNYGYYDSYRPEIIDGGYNIIETQTSGAKYTFVNGVNGNIVGIQANLNLSSSLANNASTTKTPTLALSTGSVAINAGHNTAHGPDGNQVTPASLDQRGFSRNGSIDIGSYEYDGTSSDATAPTVSSFSPLDNATNVDPSSNLIINFDENIVSKSGADNDVIIKKSADDSIVETIDAEDAKITGSGGSVITINPSNNLADNTAYYVQIGADAFDDEANNSYTGISDNTTWNFTTGDFTPPTITSVSSDKADGAYTVGETIDVDVTFSEAVTSTGDVTVTLETGDTDRTCTFTMSNATTGTCNYTVQTGDNTADLEATISGTIKDQANNTLVNFTPATGLATSKNIVIDTTAPETPVANLGAGTYTSTKSVSLSATGSSAIYYTTNGDTPTTGSTLYSSAIAVNNSQTIKALAIDAVGNQSSILTAEYILNLDSSAPDISDVSANPSSESAVISWTTNEDASSQVEYGLVGSYGNSTSEFNTTDKVTSHSVEINGLKSCAKYFYRVKSKDAFDNEGVSSQSTFYTTGCSVSSVQAGNSQKLETGGGSVSLSTDEGTAILVAPNGFFSEEAYLQINKLLSSSAPSTPENQSLIGDNFFKLLAVTSGGSIISSFDRPLTFTVNYGSEIENLYDEKSLDVYKYVNGTWEKKNCTLDTAANTLTCSLNNFSVYGVLGKPIADNTDVPENIENKETNLPVVAIGNNQTKILSQNESVALKKHTFVFYGKKINFPTGTLVKIYKNGKKIAQKRINTKKNWRFQTKQQDTISNYQFKYVNKKTGEILQISNEYQILVDKKDPRFTQIKKSATVKKGNEFTWRATDNDFVKYYSIKFQGKTYKTNEPSFKIPDTAKSKISRIIITVFDRAENKKTVKSMLKIKKK